MKFEKGKTGNAGGRPKIAAEIKEYAQQFSKEAIDELVKLMRKSKDPKTRKAAADSILDRGIGKPFQAVEVSGKDGGAIPIIREYNPLDGK